MKWENLTSEQFKKAREESKGLCIVPVGCLEKHGQHLPLGTDIFHSEEIARRAAEIEPSVVFPTMYFGEKSGAGEFDGTVIFSPKLRLDILKETCSEIARNGFKKILFLNGHGGNEIMLSYFARSVLQEKADYMVYTSFVGNLGGYADIQDTLDANHDFLTPEDIKVMEAWRDLENKTWGHACFMESALVYACRPETCDLSLMDKESGDNTGRFKEFAKRGIGSAFSWMANFPNSYDGTYHPGLNERISRAIFTTCVNSFADIIKFLKEETISTEYHKEWLAKQK